MTAPVGEAVLVERRGPVAVLSLNHSRRANALSANVRAAMFEAKRAVAEDETVRAVVVTGIGVHFCAGADLRESRAERAAARRRYPGAADMSPLPQPVVAAINGAALGGGCELALTCDFRFIADDARIGLTEIRFGALPLGGGTARLPRLVGLSTARRMIMTGEPLDAAEALRVGLVDRVLPPDELVEAAVGFAAGIARHARYALHTAKQLLNRTLEVDLDAALEMERTMVRGMAGADEMTAARAAATRDDPTYARLFATAGPSGAADTPRSRPAAQPVLDLEVTGTRQREAWQAGRLPPIEQVQPGLWSIPVIIPRSSLRYVLAYALELPDGIALVDSGWEADAAWDSLVAGLAAAGFGPGDVRAVLATHNHADHYGLAARLRDCSGAWVGLHPADAENIGDRADPVLRADLARRWAAQRARAGMPAASVTDDGVSDRLARKFIIPTRPDVLFADDEMIDLPGWRLRARWTPGHSPGHVCFVEERLGLLFAGDHVLPRITPNISVHSRQRANPLGDYLTSLAAVRDLPVSEVLPAHEYRFRGLTTRVDQLVRHHEGRLAEIEEVLAAAPGATCWEVCGRLSWSRPFDGLGAAQRSAAGRETMAHLVALEELGRARGEQDAPRRWFAADHRPGRPPD